MIRFTLNGEERSLDVDADTPLLWVLRDEVGLTGTKYGCGVAQCGACTVHVDGTPRRSCVTPVELVEAHGAVLGAHAQGVLGRLHRGFSLGSALVSEDVPLRIREEMHGHYTGEDLATSLDRHYVLQAEGDDEGAMLAEQWIDDTLRDTSRERRRAQTIGALALVPFTAFLIAHGINHQGDEGRGCDEDFFLEIEPEQRGRPDPALVADEAAKQA